MKEERVEDGSGLRTYRAPWKGKLLLACAKCQKKLRREGDAGEMAKIRKAMKVRAKESGGVRLRVLDVPCLKLCPSGGVTVCTQGQMAEGRCSVVRRSEDLDALYRMGSEVGGG